MHAVNRAAAEAQKKKKDKAKEKRRELAKLERRGHWQGSDGEEEEDDNDDDNNDDDAMGDDGSPIPWANLDREDDNLSPALVESERALPDPVRALV